MDKPWGDNIKILSPREFELITKQWVESSGGKIDSLTVKHDQKLAASDGEYQIDVVAEFDAFGAKYVTLIECKHHKSPIKREMVQVLSAKVASLGAHKGIVVASVGFQTGAIEYARKTGIALVRVVDGQASYEIRNLISTDFRGISAANVHLNLIEKRGDSYHTSCFEPSDSSLMHQLLMNMRNNLSQSK